MVTGRVASWVRRRWLWMMIGGLLGALIIATVNSDAELQPTARATVVLTPSGLTADPVGFAGPPVTIQVEAGGATPADAERAARTIARTLIDQRVEFLEDTVAAAPTRLVEDIRERADVSGGVIRASEIVGDGSSTGMPVGLVGGVLIGIVVAAGAAVAVERTSTLVFSERSLTDALHGAPVLVRLAERSLSTDVLAVRDQESSSAAAAHRALAAAVLAHLHDAGQRTVLIVAADRTAARALISANLAVALEEVGRRVVVVAADRHRNDLDHALGVAGQPGLREVLVARDEVPFAPAGQSLRVMPSGGSGDADADRASGAVPDPARIGAILSAGSRWGDVVVVDAPPSPSYPDAQILAGVADASVVVATVGVTRRSDVRVLSSRLAEANAPVIGGVLVHSPRPHRPRSVGPGVRSETAEPAVEMAGTDVSS